MSFEDSFLINSRRFQPGEGPSRGLLRDYESLCGPSFQALLGGNQDRGDR